MGCKKSKPAAVKEPKDAATDAAAEEAKAAEEARLKAEADAEAARLKAEADAAEAKRAAEEAEAARLAAEAAEKEKMAEDAAPADEEGGPADDGGPADGTPAGGDGPEATPRDADGEQPPAEGDEPVKAKDDEEPRPEKKKVSDYKAPEVCDPCTLDEDALRELEKAPCSPRRSPLGEPVATCAGKVGCDLGDNHDPKQCKICYLLDLSDQPLLA